MYFILFFVFFIWLVLLFLDTIFKSCMFHPYYRALEAAGITIKPFVILWKTTRFNRCINRLGTYRTSLQRTWFNIGAIVTCAIILPSFFLYVTKLVAMFETDTAEEFEDSNFVPVIPGYNFPASHWKVYGCIIFVCSIFHEFGHALAASRLGISLDSWGFALIFIVPVAYVDLRVDHVAFCTKWEKMTIFCAGIWHNVVLGLCSLFSLKYFYLFVWPLFYVGGGVIVLEIHEQSGINGPGGLMINEHVYKLGTCEVNDLDTWNMCLDQFEERSQGFCVPEQLLHLNSENIDECAADSGSLYFHEETKGGVCLQVRKAMQTYTLCMDSSECEGSVVLCVFPKLQEDDRFLVINKYQTPGALLVATIDELRNDVLMSEFLPRDPFLSPSIAETAKEFLEYLLLFSSGLTCLNVLPVLVLDGMYITETIIHMCLSSCFSFERRKCLVKCISTFTMGFIALLISVTLYKMYIFHL